MTSVHVHTHRIPTGSCLAEQRPGSWLSRPRLPARGLAVSCPPCWPKRLLLLAFRFHCWYEPHNGYLFLKNTHTHAFNRGCENLYYWRVNYNPFKQKRLLNSNQSFYIKPTSGITTSQSKSLLNHLGLLVSRFTFCNLIIVPSLHSQVHIKKF